MKMVSKYIVKVAGYVLSCIAKDIGILKAAKKKQETRDFVGDLGYFSIVSFFV